MALLTLIVYLAVLLVDLSGLAVAFIPKTDREFVLKNLRESGCYAGYSDWQIITILMLLSTIPYFNIVLVPSASANVTELIKKLTAGVRIKGR